MNLSRKVRWVIILALVALLAVGGAGAVAATGSQDGASGIAGSDPQHETHSHEGFGLRVDLLSREAIEAAVANALNVNPDDLRAAMQAGQDSVQTLLNAAGRTSADVNSAVKAEFESQLTTAVEAGTLTQEEMKAILSHEMDAILSYDHGREDSGDDHDNDSQTFEHIIDDQAVLQTAAAKTGLDAEALLAALTKGRSALDTFLAANGTTPAEFQAALDTAWQQALADAVAVGILSSEQANRLNQEGVGHGHDGLEHSEGHGSAEDHHA